MLVSRRTSGSHEPPPLVVRAKYTSLAPLRRSMNTTPMLLPAPERCGWMELSALESMRRSVAGASAWQPSSTHASQLLSSPSQ